MNEIHQVKATSFADPADIRAFLRCKARGMTDQQAFKWGDNGIGCWGDSCAEGSGPRCALPPEDWEPIDPVHPHVKARGAKVKVCANSREVICELRDTMPHRANITNGAGIDLSPDAVAALGLHCPLDIKASWQFV